MNVRRDFPVMLRDRYGRPLFHLRFSVTNRCNYACIYCHREGEEFPSNKPFSKELKPEDLYIVAKAAYDLGIRKFKLTGGEPLIRKDIIEIVEKLSSLNPLDLAITTNGYFLPELADKLKDAGLKRINISLPSLRRETYKRITKVDGLTKVIEGIKRAVEVGLKPVKINYLILKNYNENEFWNLVMFARDQGAILQVIELQPEGLGLKEFNNLYVDISKFESEIRKKSEKIVYRKHMHNRPQYYVDGAIVEFVRPLCNPIFCMHCTRIRLSSDGKLKPCLFKNNLYIDLAPILHIKNISFKEVKKAIITINNIREPYFKMDEKLTLTNRNLNIGGVKVGNKDG